MGRAQIPSEHRLHLYCRFVSSTALLKLHCRPLDSAYISRQFCPSSNNSVTVWIALDDADEERGIVEYAPGSKITHRSI